MAKINKSTREDKQLSTKHYTENKRLSKLSMLDFFSLNITNHIATDHFADKRQYRHNSDIIRWKSRSRLGTGTNMGQGEMVKAVNGIPNHYQQI